MTEPQVEAGDRALDTARKIMQDITEQAAPQNIMVTFKEEGNWATLIQSAMNAQEREIAKLIDLYTGPTGGWLVAPIFLKAEIERLLAERREKI